MAELLELHRASAGSGKTYMLAKKFLWYFLTVRDEDGRRRLRTVREAGDSLGHILAITFTNKATDEMRHRIVEKLDALAWPPAGKTPDYMDEFCTALGVSSGTLSALCRHALRLLLENYSEFQVSTIDSFFQLVLRTFAYETDLNDSYSVELDSDYLSQTGIDAMLEDIEEGRASREVRFWINLLMRRVREAGGKWNIFQKRGGDNPYAALASAIGRLENEDFKEIRECLEEYLENTADLPEMYLYLEKRYGEMPRAPYDRMCAAARELAAWIGGRTDATLKSLSAHAAKSLACRFNRTPSGSAESFAVYDKFSGKTYQSRRAADPGFYDTAERLYRVLVAAREEWMAVLGSPEYRHWQLYSRNFPYFGLLSVSLAKRRQFLEENNAVELAETNSLLSRIIGKDDTPFIYERLGTRLNHFLIDEFQDTSRMQWSNLLPLLAESMGRGNGNLLIGDAKQSIYRFRNADPSLISSRVEEVFDQVATHGDAPGENTNWRSDRNIVEFNNGFFTLLADALSNETADNPARLDFRHLYGNVAQTPRGEYGKGYVEANFVDGKSDEAEACILDSCVDLIGELLARGYRQSDIVFLVDTNRQGELLIDRFTMHNSDAGEEDFRIEFLSEQSLKVGASPSVQLILTALTTIGRGADPEIRGGEEGTRKGVADWKEVECNYSVFALRNPGMSVTDTLAAFLESGADTDAVGSMLSTMQAVTLPALVEGIAATFLPEETRRRDAPFIAAFQDIVLEYCESRPSDIASFLDWWEKRGSRAAISSPEGMDAVKVMTVHKAKGLEFPCVVMPFAQYVFLPTNIRKTEWRWVRPQVIDAGEYTLPPFLPVDTGKEMEGTAHEAVMDEYVDMVTMDCLNKLYVGFTRAVSELYIFCAGGQRPQPLSTAGMLRRYHDGEYAGNEELQQLCWGTKYVTAPVKRAPEDRPADVLADYTAHATPDFLRYREEDVPVLTDAGEYGEEADTDPRSEGNVLHAVMERVVTAADLESSVRRAVNRGLLDRAKGEAIRNFLAAEMERDEIKGWFDGSARVLNERPVIGGGRGLRRPDRIMVYDDGSAVVVDYKFGEITDSGKYRRQVADYMSRLRATGLYRSVSGFLWYVKEGKVESVGGLAT